MGRFFASLLVRLGRSRASKGPPEESVQAATQLRAWLQEHLPPACTFTDYLCIPSTDGELASILGDSWFRSASWNAPGYFFHSLGWTGSGSQIALWVRPGAAPPFPVVFFGSEGGHGVLTATSDAWPQALAHGPLIEEYPVPSRLSATGNWLLSEDEDGAAAAALAVFRAAVTARFGPLPPLASLTEGLEALQEEFCGWVGPLQAASAAEETREQDALTDQAAARQAELEALVAGEQMTCPKCESGRIRVLRGMALQMPRLGCRDCGRSFEP